MILPFIFAVSSLAANYIAVINSYYYHSDHKDSSHTPDDDHPIRNVRVYRMKITKTNMINKHKNNTLPWFVPVRK